MSKCSTCVLAKNLLEQTQPYDVKAAIIKDRSEHLQRQQYARFLKTKHIAITITLYLKFNIIGNIPLKSIRINQS